MSPEMIGALVDGSIPLLGGVYATLLGHRVLGKKEGEDVKYDAWYERYGGLFKWLGPALILFGILQLALGLSRSS